MAVYTEYDRRRDKLKRKLKMCLEDARELLDPDIWGYEDMRKDYGIDVYKAIKDAYETI